MVAIEPVGRRRRGTSVDLRQRHDGENSETQHWLATALNCGCREKSGYVSLLQRSDEIQLGVMIKSPEIWKPKE